MGESTIADFRAQPGDKKMTGRQQRNSDEKQWISHQDSLIHGLCADGWRNRVEVHIENESKFSNQTYLGFTGILALQPLPSVNSRAERHQMKTFFSFRKPASDLLRR